MLMIAITPLLWLLSGISLAVCDAVCTSIAFNASIFRNLNPLYWDKERSGNSNGLLTLNFLLFKVKTKYRWDAWHNFKSLALTLQLLSLPFYLNNVIIHPAVDWLLIGVFYLMGFNPAYAIFKPKKK